MAFTFEDFSESTRILERHPELRDELRRWVLTEELLTLPQLVRELAVAQQRTEGRVAELPEAQQRTEGRVAELPEAQQLTEERPVGLTQSVDQLGQRLDQLTAQVQQMVEVQFRMASDLEDLKGSELERRYRERAHSFFSRLIRRAHVLSPDELLAYLDDAVAKGQLSEGEADEIFRTDVVVRGLRRDDATQVYLVAEIFWGVGMSDVQRASDRARMLAKAGTVAFPVVAGHWVAPDAREPARALGVWQFTDGQVTPPDGDQSPP